MTPKLKCSNCQAELMPYYLKDGMCNACRNPESVMVAALSFERKQSMQISDRYFVRDSWIENDSMLSQGEIVEIGYQKNTEIPVIVLMQFPDSFKTYWFPVIALKKD